MTVHAFVDESKRDTYVMVAAIVTVSDLSVTRTTVRSLQLPGTRRVHFQTEGDSIRRKFLAALGEMPINARIYVASARKDLDARRAILTRMIPDLLDLGTSRLVLERDDSLVTHDERAIKLVRSLARAADALRFDHLRGTEEPLLWIPDAIAWAWCRDRSWRALVNPMVTEVATL